MMLTSSVPDWVPFCVKCANKDQQGNVLAAFTDAITAAVDEKEVYVYGAHSFADVDKLDDIAQLSIDRQALVCFKSEKVSEPEEFAEVEKKLMEIAGVNAVVVDPTSRCTYVWTNKEFAKSPHGASLEVGVTVGWPCYLALVAGEQVSAKSTDPYIGIYGATKFCELRAMKDAIMLMHASSMDVKVVPSPPSLQVAFPNGGFGPNGCHELAQSINNSLAAEGFSSTVGSARVVLWEAPGIKTGVTKTLTRSDATISAVVESLHDLEVEVVAAVPKLQPLTTSKLVFQLGVSKTTAVRRLVHNLKVILQECEVFDLITGAYMDFGASHLVLTVTDADKVLAKVPEALTEFTKGVAVKALPALSPGAEAAEFALITNYMQQMPPTTMDAAKQVVSGVTVTGVTNIQWLVEYVKLRMCLGVCDVVASPTKVYVQHDMALTSEEMVAIFTTLGCEVQVTTDGQQQEEYNSVLKKQRAAANAIGKRLLGEENYVTVGTLDATTQSELPASTVEALTKTWVFWFDVSETGKTAQTAQSFEDNLKQKGSFNEYRNLQQLWSAFDVGQLLEGRNLRLFQQGIKPVWEDPANKDGGKWVARQLDPQNRAKAWGQIVHAICTGALKDDMNQLLSGVVLSTKAGADTIQVWCGSESKTLGSALQKLVRDATGAASAFTYQSHATKKKATLRPHGKEEMGAESEATERKKKPSGSERKKVLNFLRECNPSLEMYYDAFIEDGFETMEAVKAIDDQDLKNMEVKLFHRKIFKARLVEYEKRSTKTTEERGKASVNWREQERPRKGEEGHFAQRAKTMDVSSLMNEPTLTPERKSKSMSETKFLQALSERNALNSQSQTSTQQDPVNIAAQKIAPSAAATMTAFSGTGGNTSNTMFNTMTMQQQLLYMQNFISPFNPLWTMNNPSMTVPPAFAPVQMHNPALFSNATMSMDWAQAPATMGSMASMPSVMNTTVSTGGTATAASTFKLNPQAAAFKPSSVTASSVTTAQSSKMPKDFGDVMDGSANEDEDDGEKRSGWRDMKNGREWREMEPPTDEQEREEWNERMEERVAVELTRDSQEAIKQAYPNTDPDWQVLGKFVFIRNHPAEGKPLPGGTQIGDSCQLELTGVGKNPRLLALKFDGIQSEVGVAHCVVYKATCTRQEESNYISNWEKPEKKLTLQGVVKQVWRMRPPKRTNNNRKKQAAKRNAAKAAAESGQMDYMPPVNLMTFQPTYPGLIFPMPNTMPAAMLQTQMEQAQAFNALKGMGIAHVSRS
mmetsp:Transcript_129405/g.223582  ORF Transcript_129405/g.223582 Transcript_129405/m.223582 type:complete len:1259 (-) Transcript_129405:247-4023(-)